jgi:hypothetical protein
MIIAAFIGWSAVSWFGAGLSTLFQIIALAAVSYGLLTAAAVLGGAWGGRPASQTAPTATKSGLANSQGPDTIRDLARDARSYR